MPAKKRAKRGRGSSRQKENNGNNPYDAHAQQPDGKQQTKAGRAAAQQVHQIQEVQQGQLQLPADTVIQPAAGEAGAQAPR